MSILPHKGQYVFITTVTSSTNPFFIIWSKRRDSNSQQSACKAEALPLSYLCIFNLGTQGGIRTLKTLRSKRSDFADLSTQALIFCIINNFILTTNFHCF